MKTIKAIRLITTICLGSFIFGCNFINSSTPLPSGNGQDVNTEVPTESVISTAANVKLSDPCSGEPAPSQWNHVLVLMFEHHHGGIGSPSMPYITSLAAKCGTANNWSDADFQVNGVVDGEYNSKPSYATLTNGLSPTAHGLIDDEYESKTDTESIFDQLNKAEKSFKVYYDAEAGGCSVDFNGAYHDPIRYYNSMTSICDQHDVPLSTFMTDLNSGNLPVFSMIIPSNDHNQHDNSLESGDAWAKKFLEPVLSSATYQQGDVAVFFLWDEDNPVPNVLIAPSIVPSSKVPESSSGNPISHFSALRTWEEMLGLPLLGDTDQAPSLLAFFGGL